MKKILPFFLLLAGTLAANAEYTDHRSHRTDSLENVIAGWTSQRLENATDAQYDDIIHAYRDLMWAYIQINRDRSIFCATKVYELGARKNYLNTMADAKRMLGMHMYGSGQYDSALVLYGQALDITDRMAAGENPEDGKTVYDRKVIDDNYSNIYGSIANCYNLMDSIPRAMEYYAKAGEIFERNGWNESSSILWHNIGETWAEEGEWSRAKDAYEKALEYARVADDSLLVANAFQGLGSLYAQKGRTLKALRYLKDADNYYANHVDQEFMARIENFDYMDKVLTRQTKQLRLIAIAGILLALLMLALMITGRWMRKLKMEKDGADAVISEALLEQDNISELTEREAEILPLVASGMTSQQIADKLFLSLPTIKWYRKKLLVKFEAANTADLIRKAKEKGLI
ncbi:MAG: LuxR family transcriptional regulator [Bacteroidales bacterium]|nr:LuxR family transcriptional regulator [Bacteroidales bacterium]